MVLRIFWTDLNFHIRKTLHILNLSLSECSDLSETWWESPTCPLRTVLSQKLYQVVTCLFSFTTLSTKKTLCGCFQTITPQTSQLPWSILWDYSTVQAALLQPSTDITITAAHFLIIWAPGSPSFLSTQLLSSFFKVSTYPQTSILTIRPLSLCLLSHLLHFISTTHSHGHTLPRQLLYQLHYHHTAEPVLSTHWQPPAKSSSLVTD
jgi:hypothetical protein